MGRILFRTRAGRSRWLRHLGEHSEGALLSLFWRLVRPMHPARASATGRVLFRRLGPRIHKHRQLRDNLALAFPDLEEEKLEALARDIWGNFGAVLAEYPHLDKIAVNADTAAVEPIIDDAARTLLDSRRPTIYVTPHLGNWELAASTIAGLGIPLSVIYSPQSNPILERMIQSQRRTIGCRFIAKHNAIRHLVREIRSGRSVGLLPDQRVDGGEAVPFFGLDAPTTISPAWLALKFNCPLLPVQVERIGDARYRVIFHAPLGDGAARRDHRQQLLQMTQLINCTFEDWIRQRPQQWFCSKRRWPKTAYQPIR